MATVTHRATSSLASTHNGSRFPVENRRVSPTDASKFIQRTDYLTVEEYFDEPSVCFARLYEASTAEVGGKGLVVRAAVGQRQWSGTVAFPPQPSTYYYNPYMGFIFFNKADLGQEIVVSYTAKGSIIAAEEINWLWDATKNAAMPYIEANIELPGNVTYTLEGIIANAVYEQIDLDDEGRFDLILNPPNVEVRITGLHTKELYQTVVKNTDPTAVRKFKIRGVPRMTPDK